MTDPVPPGSDDSGLDRAWSPILAPTGSLQLPGLTPAADAGGFRVDVDAAATPIAALDEALDRLTGTLVLLRRGFAVERPAEDHVSARIAQNNGLMFDNAHEYVRVLRDQVEAARDALRAQLDSYRRVDEARIFRS